MSCGSERELERHHAERHRQQQRKLLEDTEQDARGQEIPMNQQPREEWHEPGARQAAPTFPDRPPRHQTEERQGGEKWREAARRSSEESLLQNDERHESEEEGQVCGNGNEELQPRPGRPCAAASSKLSSPRAEAERKKQQTVTVHSRD